ncbi:MAG TPA: nucleotidyltransferase domain-containing protein [Thermoanaerobaculia bacterium]|nr:nucleotidyltransferase domain-containing protein [Thermoanaerobaculia bacterium]
MPHATLPDAAVDDLQRATGADWPTLQAGRRRAAGKRAELAAAVAGLSGGDTGVVVFGSLARDEFGGESDIDWTLLVDGPADPGHLDLAHRIAAEVDRLGRPPGREGTFGSLAFSHELIHKIGGEDDTNSNTTRRILLLLESAPVGRRDAYDRVVGNVLRRYLDEDRGLWTGSGRPKVPRFLLNDISRYWRTMLVDFTYKQASRAGRGWALRNIKLRTSRKLIFLAGLLTCFSPLLDLDDDDAHRIFGPERDLPRLLAHLERRVAASPLDLLAHALLAEGHLEAGRAMFDAYEEFLALIGDPERRGRLAALTYERLGDDPVFAEGRRIANDFQQAVGAVFLDPATRLGRLTIEYGIF